MSCTQCVLAIVFLSAPFAAQGRQLHEAQSSRELQGAFGDFMHGVGTLVNGVVDTAGDIAAGAIDGGGQVLGGAVGGEVGDAIAEGASGVADLVDEGSDVVGDVAAAVVETTPEILQALFNGRQCWLSIGRGARLGMIAGPEGAIVGGAIGALVNLGDCIDAVKYAKDAVGNVLDTAKARREDIQCAAGATAVFNGEECATQCEGMVSECDVLLRMEASCCSCEEDCSSKLALGTSAVNLPGSLFNPSTSGTTGSTESSGATDATDTTGSAESGIGGIGGSPASAPSQCPAGSETLESTDPGTDCSKLCATKLPGCQYYWRYQSGCCSCTPTSDRSCTDASASGTSNGTSTLATGTCPTHSVGLNLQPVYINGIPIGDIAQEGKPLSNATLMWVQADTPDHCCQACTEYPACYAWTWKDIGYCKIEGVEQPFACCFFKAVSGWTIQYRMGDKAEHYVSGLSASLPPAECNRLQSDVDLWLGDMVTDIENSPDTVVTAANPQECCNFCKAFKGCLAWTLTDPSDCEDRLGTSNEGCCWLKTTGYERKAKDGAVSGFVVI